MPRSFWRLHINSDKKENAETAVNRCVKLLNRSPVEVELYKYSNGGFMSDLQFFHDEDLSWPQLVFDLLEMGERIGTGWLLSGKISMNPSGTLNSISPATTVKEAGLNWVSWEIENSA